MTQQAIALYKEVRRRGRCAYLLLCRVETKHKIDKKGALKSAKKMRRHCSEIWDMIHSKEWDDDLAPRVRRKRLSQAGCGQRERFEHLMKKYERQLLKILPAAYRIEERFDIFESFIVEELEIFYEDLCNPMNYTERMQRDLFFSTL